MGEAAFGVGGRSALIRWSLSAPDSSTEYCHSFPGSTCLEVNKKEWKGVHVEALAL